MLFGNRKHKILSIAPNEHINPILVANFLDVKKMARDTLCP